MTVHKLRSIIELGENDRVEFKRKFSGYEKIAREMIALANTRGGYLIVGIDDDGSVVGVESEKSEIDLLTTAAEVYSDPPIMIDIDIVDIDGTDVIVLTIPDSPLKPHRLIASQNGSHTEPTRDDPHDTRVYIRQADRSVMASREVVRVLQASSPDAPALRLEIGPIERALLGYLETTRRITLREFRQIVNISERRASRTLVRLVRAGLIRIFTNEAEDYYTLS